MLRATRKIDGTFYHFSATPAGDKLTVHPYTGPLGVLEVSPGGRSVRRILATGVLAAPTTTVPVFVNRSGDDSPESTSSCQLPLGDYRLEYVDVQFDNLSLVLVHRPGFEDKPRDKPSQADGYPIAIRADRPFVLDLSRKPQVLFTAPNKDSRIQLGQELGVKAVLVGPSLGILFRGLGRDGKLLIPKVNAARANGEIVAEGVMPFG